MSRKSSDIPPRGALTWPSNEVPAPKGMTGTRSAAHSRTTCCTSSVFCGNTTASGGWLAIQVVVWACCSRTAWDVTIRLPNCAASCPITLSAALRSCGVRCFASTSAIVVLLVSLEARRLDRRLPHHGIVFHNRGERSGGSSCRLQAEGQHPILELRRAHGVNNGFVISFDQ